MYFYRFLSDNDRKLRKRICRKMCDCTKRNRRFWKKEVAFYLDGISFIHRYKPVRALTTMGMARVWHQQGEGLGPVV